MPARALADWMRLVRLPNALVAGGGVWLGHACLAADPAAAGGAAAGSGGLDIRAASLGSLAMALLAAAGNAHNDLLDLPVDRVNRPDRPLPSGRLRPAAAAAAAALLALASLACAAALGWGPALLTAAMACLLAAYNLRLKALPLVGNLAVALLCALAVYLPELPDAPARTGIPALFALLATLARELAKDAEDMPGDRTAGWRTFPLAAGLPATRGVLMGLTASVLLLLPVPFLVMGYGAAYALLAGLLAAPLLVLILFGLFDRIPDWGRIQRGWKGIMLAGMAAILAGVL